MLYFPPDKAVTPAMLNDPEHPAPVPAVPPVQVTPDTVTVSLAVSSPVVLTLLCGSCAGSLVGEVVKVQVLLVLVTAQFSISVSDIVVDLFAPFGVLKQLLPAAGQSVPVVEIVHAFV